MRHELKCWPPHFAAVESGAKPYEVRLNDRGYQVGDTLVLREYQPGRWPERGGYSGREVERTVTHLLADFPGLAPGYVMLGLAPVAVATITPPSDMPVCKLCGKAPRTYEGRTAWCDTAGCVMQALEPCLTTAQWLALHGPDPLAEAQRVADMVAKETKPPAQ